MLKDLLTLSLSFCHLFSLSHSCFPLDPTYLSVDMPAVILIYLLIFACLNSVQSLPDSQMPLKLSGPEPRKIVVIGMQSLYRA